MNDMSQIIKQALDDAAKSSSQINLDSNSARIILASLIEKRLTLWQNQKDQENIKKNED